MVGGEHVHNLRIETEIMCVREREREMCVRACVCVCACLQERNRERKRECVCVHAPSNRGRDPLLVLCTSDTLCSRENTVQWPYVHV